MWGLNVALQAVIDYHGFRMHAQSWLPINHAQTLRVGSSDGGRKVHPDPDPKPGPDPNPKP